MSQSPSRLVLTTARHMIEDERNWLQHGWKRANQYRTKRCAYQAVADAARQIGIGGAPALAAMTRIIGVEGECPRGAISCFNDDSTHADVLTLFDLALESV